jgi:hypothetical protein
VSSPVSLTRRRCSPPMNELVQLVEHVPVERSGSTDIAASPSPLTDALRAPSSAIHGLVTAAVACSPHEPNRPRLPAEILQERSYPVSRLSPVASRRTTPV